jgi:hypothetical protein
MSLINDALKRARESQTDLIVPPPVSTLQFKPANPAETKARTGGQWPIFTIAGLVLLGLIYAVRVANLRQSDSNAPALQVEARTAAAAPSPAITAAKATPASSVGVASDEERAYFGDDELDAATGTQAASVKAPAYKLQAIIYEPRRPLAIVNGKSLFVGDKFGTLKVSSITKDTVTLAGAGQTNILSLEQ